jgi:hypothetical protein
LTAPPAVNRNDNGGVDVHVAVNVHVAVDDNDNV